MKEDRRVKKTEAAITNALLKLLKTQNFNDITINSIAEKADVNRGTIYFHYDDKYDLLQKCIDKKLDELQSICEPININVSNKDLHSYFIAVYQFFDDNYTFFSLMLKNGGTEYFRIKFKHQITIEMKRATYVKESVNENEFSIQFKVSALTGVIEWWIKENHSFSVQEMAENTLILFLNNR